MNKSSPARANTKTKQNGSNNRRHNREWTKISSWDQAPRGKAATFLHRLGHREEYTENHSATTTLPHKQNVYTWYHILERTRKTQGTQENLKMPSIEYGHTKTLSHWHILPSRANCGQRELGTSAMARPHWRILPSRANFCNLTRMGSILNTCHGFLPIGSLFFIKRWTTASSCAITQ